MFDPFAKIVYDYVGGMEDIIKAKVCMYLFDATVSYISFFNQKFKLSIIILCKQVRTIAPAATSFQEDCGEFWVTIHNRKTYFLTITHILGCVNFIEHTFSSE